MTSVYPSSTLPTKPYTHTHTHTYTHTHPHPPLRDQAAPLPFLTPGRLHTWRCVSPGPLPRACHPLSTLKTRLWALLPLPQAGNEPGPGLQLNTSLLLPHFLNFCLRRYGCVCLIERRSLEDENYLRVILTYPSLLENIKKVSDGGNSYGVMWTQFRDQKWQLSTLLMASSGPWLAYSLIYCNTSCTSQESKILDTLQDIYCGEEEQVWQL